MYAILAQVPVVDVPINVPQQWVPWIALGLGIVVLLFGRSLYWLFVAIAGFLIGWEMAKVWMQGQEEWMQLLVAIGGGVLGAIIGIFLQRFAFAVGGFFAGGYFAVAIAARFGLAGDPNIWAIAGGVVGAILAALLMDWAIIVLSSLAGAAAIMSPFQPKLDPRVSAGIYLALVAVGIVFQGRRYMATRLPPVGPPPAVV